MQKNLKLIVTFGLFTSLLIGCNTATTSSVVSSSSFQFSSSESSSSELPKPTYTITWKNENGDVLEIDQNVEEGKTPTYDGAEPTKEKDAQYTYVWLGWTPAVVPASANATYTATYQNETREYEITWKNENGDVLATDVVAYGQVPAYSGEEPTKDSTIEHVYSFSGWTPSPVEVTGNATYVASFKEEPRKYTITWKNENDEILGTDEVDYGTVPAYAGETPIKESTKEYSYTWTGWEPQLAPVIGDATYTAIYTGEIRKYTVSWINDDGTILELDEGILYGSMPTYDGETPTKPSGRGVNYTFSHWSPEIGLVEGDTTYVAQYSKDGFFTFEPINYEMEEGYNLSDITGAPWINSNVKGELDKIRKPSLKDDFYASVNYDAIKNGTPGAFDKCDIAVDNAFNTIYYGEGNETTNGNFLLSAFNNINVGDVDTLKDYFSNLSVDDYLSSKESFTSSSSLLKIAPYKTGYLVDFNDGYMNGTFGLYTLHAYGGYDDFIKPILFGLSNILDLGISQSEYNDISSFESEMVNKAYYDYYNYGDTPTIYYVRNVPWAKMKSALLDMGLTEGSKIYIKTYYKSCFTSLYNSYAANNPGILKNVIKSRLGFDSRFLLGLDNYRSLNQSITTISYYTGMYNNETNLYSYSDNYVSKALLRLGFPVAFEQSYIELNSSEEIKQEVTDLIQDILAGYKEMAEANDWLGNTTKSRLIKKLDKMAYASCYSDGFKNFPKLDDSNLDNETLYQLYTDYSQALFSTELAGTADKTGYWDYMPSYTVNAFYSPNENLFVILNGIAAGCLGESIEEKYGMIGTVIGHEITHAFDSSGANYDENGEYKNWWSSADKSEFSRRVNKMSNFYDNIKLKDGLTVDGDSVNGEATADMGGVKIMLHLAKKIPDFDYDVFFRSYADVWLNRPISFDNIESRASDVHPFNYLRTNVTLAQFDEFVETYNIEPGDGMYIPENQRVKIW
ncbi:MAG: hypothetical protein MJ216_00325 [Bacilli bacterium]|nr:hypothetical protein [Bacilli bacterium]